MKHLTCLKRKKALINEKWMTGQHLKSKEFSTGLNFLLLIEIEVCVCEVQILKSLNLTKNSIFKWKQSKQISSNSHEFEHSIRTLRIDLIAFFLLLVSRITRYTILLVFKLNSYDCENWKLQDIKPVKWVTQLNYYY